VKNYNLYFSNRTICDRASGGVAIFARSDYPTTQVPLQSPLEAIAITIQLQSNIKLNNFEFNCSEILKHEHPIYPLWTMELHYNINLSQHIKRETSDNIFRNLAHSILEDYQDHTKLFTDGSKTEAGVGASVYYKNVIKIIKFPDFCMLHIHS